MQLTTYVWSFGKEKYESIKLNKLINLKLFMLFLQFQGKIIGELV